MASHLLLAHDERLTVGWLLHHRLTADQRPGPRLVVLSACETALIGTC